MITKEDIDRINFLSRKSRGEGLTEEEKLEQQNLRRRYIDYIKSQVRTQLDSIEYVEDKEGCDCGCSCGHNHEHGHSHEHKHHKHHKHSKN